jgi:2-(1,2-epoxy-1,2-dihydrophenyl)acetyl-CoA isomerase
MSFEAVTWAVQDGVAHLTLNRPGRGNAIDATLCAELSEVAIQCDEDDAIRCLLVDSTGKWFSTGGDLARLGESREGAPAFVKRATTQLHSAFSRFARMSPPVVVAMRGGAIGAGVAFAAAADYCLVTEDVRFLAGYSAIGMTVDAGLSYFLPRRVGTRAASDYFLRNRTWSAAEAHRLGLVTEVVPADDLDIKAFALATALAEGPTLAYGELKNLLLDTWDSSLETQLEREARALARATRTEDGWHGITSALAGEPPHFSGR